MDSKTQMEIHKLRKTDWRTIAILTISIGVISLYGALITFSYSEWAGRTDEGNLLRSPFRHYSTPLLLIGVLSTIVGLGAAIKHLREEILKRKKKLLFLSTLILLILTAIWAVAFYEHILAYNRMIEGYPLVYGIPHPLFLWRNGQLFRLTGIILALSWVTRIALWYIARPFETSKSRADIGKGLSRNTTDSRHNQQNYCARTLIIGEIVYTLLIRLGVLPPLPLCVFLIEPELH